MALIQPSGTGHIAPPYTPGFEVATFVWSNEHGHCYECGLPAAFYLPVAYLKEEPGATNEGDEGPTEWNKRCAVCAANAAAEGEAVKRIDEED